ncbi:hypothetical protein P154DRAFT_526858 [Amniculicola lignicola CBS 123094]|uniref:SIMPL domain-containing protein n=1 Tax=Amniculicola lignicola CBS 123094 TaxID=1392246 RepID=A0A6A5VY91_9PLEO|nr:hypothetical protein P154DRAFT_526858 [Amniculicola lignicola CBS 123094]
MARLEINVTGAGHTISPAERAILVLQAQSGQLATAAEASATVTATANALRDAILPHCPQDDATGRTLEGAPIAHYSMSTLDTNSHRERISTSKDEWTEKSKVEYETTFSARAEMHIKFSDFSLLNTLATQFSAWQNVKIQKISWCLTDRTLDSIKGATRKKAAKDAIQRAYDYAEVFAGIEESELKSKVKAVSINENNYYSQSTRPQLHYGKGMRMKTSVVEKEELMFQPEDVRLEATVSGKFVVED